MSPTVYIRFFTTQKSVDRIKKTADYLGVENVNRVTGLLFEEFSHVPPQLFHEALGSIARRYKKHLRAKNRQRAEVEHIAAADQRKSA